MWKFAKISQPLLKVIQKRQQNTELRFVCFDETTSFSSWKQKEERTAVKRTENVELFLSAVVAVMLVWKISNKLLALFLQFNYGNAIINRMWWSVLKLQYNYVSATRDC